MCDSIHCSFVIMKTRRIFRNHALASKAALILSLFPGLQIANAKETEAAIYYWVVPGGDFTTSSPNSPDESFVIPVNAAQAAEIESIRSAGGRPGFGGYIAAGEGGFNKNYHAPGQPAWNWHVTRVDSLFDFEDAYFVPCECPTLTANPSEIAQDPEAWIQANGTAYGPTRYEIGPRIDPTKRDSMANVSNRGVAGVGERTLITGFIITGGEPRNVVLRGLGPSLFAAGISNPVTNPRIDLYREGQPIYFNRDWNRGGFVDELTRYHPGLVPTHEKEAAMLLTLMPGAYTFHGSNEDGTEGVMLLEAYDVDAGSEL